MRESEGESERERWRESEKGGWEGKTTKGDWKYSCRSISNVVFSKNNAD